MVFILGMRSPFSPPPEVISTMASGCGVVVPIPTLFWANECKAEPSTANTLIISNLSREVGVIMFRGN